MHPENCEVKRLLADPEYKIDIQAAARKAMEKDHIRYDAHKPTLQELEWLFAEDDSVVWVNNHHQMENDMGDKEDLDRYQRDAKDFVEREPKLKLAAYYHYMKTSGDMDLDKAQKLIDNARMGIK